MCFVPINGTTSSAVATVLLDSQYELSNSSSPVTHGVWFIWAITGNFVIFQGDGAGENTINSYINSSLHSTIIKGSGLLDSDSNDFTLGAGF